MLFTKLFLNLLSFSLAFSIVIITIPAILRVARAKKLFDPFDDRKIHSQTVPPLGGVGIFLGFILSTIIASDGYAFSLLKYIIAAVILMFFTGLKDDLVAISARKKFVIQLFAAIILVTLGEVKITNLYGLLGFYEINFAFGTLISLFLMLAIINAFNLIDGIDGLASGLAIVASFFAGVWFFIAGYMPYAIMSFALCGSLAGFFLFNVFGQRNKLFMGDTGSLVVGTVIAILVIKFNEFNAASNVPFAIDAAPAVSFAVVIVPLIDTLRVIVIRILRKKSPFSPDTNHIHHRLLVLFPNHLTVTLIILSANIFLIGTALFFNHLSFNVNMQFLLIFLIGVVFSFIPSKLVARLQIEEKRHLTLLRSKSAS